MINKEKNSGSINDAGCMSCKYRFLQNYELPCFFCIKIKDKYTQWIPAKLCSSCIHEVKTIFTYPCSYCNFGINNDHNYWESKYDK